MANSKLGREVSPLLRRPEVEQRTGLKKTAIYDQMATGEFPRPRRISARCVAWVAAEIDAWIEARPTR